MGFISHGLKKVFGGGGLLGSVLGGLTGGLFSRRRRDSGGGGDARARQLEANMEQENRRRNQKMVDVEAGLENEGGLGGSGLAGLSEEERNEARLAKKKILGS